MNSDSTLDRQRITADDHDHDASAPDVTINVPGPDGAPFASDFMPALIATLPILAVTLLFALSGQPVLFRAIMYEGNVAALAVSFLPLFMPTIAAVSIYLAAWRGWVHQSPAATASIAMAVAGGLALFVPLNYLFLQAGALAGGLLWRRVRRRSHRTRVVAVSVAILIMTITIGSIAEWKWWRADHLLRTVVGRALDGVTRMNIGEGQQRRSVMVISVNDAYAVVASRGYPPQVEAVSLEALNGGELCQLPPNWNQRSVVDHLHIWIIGEGVSSTPPCVAS